MARFNILQIISATPGWAAEYPTDRGDHPYHGRVAFWALVEDRNAADRRYVIGVDPATVRDSSGADAALIEIQDVPRHHGYVIEVETGRQ